MPRTAHDTGWLRKYLAFSSGYEMVGWISTTTGSPGPFATGRQGLLIMLMRSSKILLFLGFQVCLWVGLTVATRLSWFGYEPPGWDQLFLYTAFGFLFSSLLGAAFTKLFDRRALTQLLLAVLLTAVAAIAWRITTNAIEYHILEAGNAAYIFYGYIHNGRITTAQMLVWTAGFWAFHYYNRYMMQQTRADAAKAQAQAATLKLLQYQINPHFLFNALSGVDTLLLKNDNADARTMLGKLTDYLRQTLEGTPAVAVPLHVELQRVKGYLDIEKIRAGDRLKVRWQVPDAPLSIEVPNGILLPLVENAVRHGAINSRAGGYVLISVQAAKEYFLIVIENDTRGNTEAGFGIGLENTAARVETFYDRAATFDVDQKDGVFRVSLRVPI